MAIPRDAAERNRIAARGQQIYEQLAATSLRKEDDGKFIAIDVNSSAYEVDADDLTATDRLLRRQPDAAMWLGRVGRRAAYRLGSRIARREAQ